MSQRSVVFQFVPGLKRPIFRNVRLCGSWDAQGHHAQEAWSVTPMMETLGSDGCPMFQAEVTLRPDVAAPPFRWGVILDGPSGANLWGIPTEVHDALSTERYREFRLGPPGPHPQVERYYLTHVRRLGANAYFTSPRSRRLRFAVWAPNAQAVAVVFGKIGSGYIDNDGRGIDPGQPVLPLRRQEGGIWSGSPKGDYSHFLGLPYMYRITNAQGQIVYRGDIFSRGQIGKGALNPAHDPWPGDADSLDGTVSCSLVIDPDLVRRGFDSTPPGQKPDLIPAQDFWASEFSQGQSLPSRLEDLVIYELHLGSLGFGKPGPGDLGDAMAFLDHLVELGVNAVELLPMAEFSGNVGWGYGDSHHLCIESSAGGRDKYRHFVRACHRRGIAVLQDVVYNHYDNNGERAQWQYDSTRPEDNIYYWYQGRAEDYPFPEGGYLDNGSTGFTPRFWEEMVRQQFISSAVFLIEEMHVDGLRVDLTQAIHRDNALHADGSPVASANLFGQKFLREWSRTLRLIRPTVMLVAEDHTGWDAVTKPPAQGGLGFNARWQMSFYHNLIGDSDMAGDAARLLKHAGLGGNEPLAMDRLASVLHASQYDQVVFHESHDEAGNAGGTARTLSVAVNGAPLIGPTRQAAESRARLCFGLALLSAGTPMFFMGEEVGAEKRYTYNNFLHNREDILGQRQGQGQAMFRFYQDLIGLRRRLSSIRGRNIDILHHWNDTRVIAYKRWNGQEEVIIVASFNNRAFASGYVIHKDPIAIPDAGWKEIFNSDAAIYGGQNIGNGGATLPSWQGRLNVALPANGLVVLVRQ